jgi:hypothetical protein
VQAPRATIGPIPERSCRGRPPSTAWRSRKLSAIGFACFHAFGVPLLDSEILQIRLSVFEAQLHRPELCAFVIKNLVRDLLLLYS